MQTAISNHVIYIGASFETSFDITGNTAPDLVNYEAELITTPVLSDIDVTIDTSGTNNTVTISTSELSTLDYVVNVDSKFGIVLTPKLATGYIGSTGYLASGYMGGVSSEALVPIEGTLYVRPQDDAVADFKYTPAVDLDLTFKWKNDNDVAIEVSSYSPTLYVYIGSTKNPAHYTAACTVAGDLVTITATLPGTVTTLIPRAILQLRYQIILTSPISGREFTLLSGRLIRGFENV